MGFYQGPIPTRLVALSELPGIPTGEKVRFLGWYGFFSIYLILPFTSHVPEVGSAPKVSHSLLVVFDDSKIFRNRNSILKHCNLTPYRTQTLRSA
jgi:hypothetical protein